MSHARARQDRPSTRMNLWVLFVGIGDTVYGLVYAAGGWATSPALLMMQEFLPMWTWGLLVLIAGLLLLLRRERAGGWLGGMVFCLFALTSLISVIQRTSQSSAGWVLLLLVAALHVLITHGAPAPSNQG